MHRNTWRFVLKNGCLDTGLLGPPQYWGYGIYIDFWFALPIPFFVYLWAEMAVNLYCTSMAEVASYNILYGVALPSKIYYGYRTCFAPIELALWR